MAKEQELKPTPASVDLWKGRNVCICMPIYKTLHPATDFCKMAMWDPSTMRYETRSGDMIVRTRNHLSKRFMDGGAEWSMWIDDDMVLPFGHAARFKQLVKPDFDHVADQWLNIHTINRLVSHGKTIVGGCYWDRRGSDRLICGSSRPIMHSIPSDNIVPVGFIGTGCLLVHRKVFEDIGKKFPEALNKDGLGNECGYFTEFMKDGRMWGEDESFAWRAAQCGHQSWLDLAVLCGHAGTKFYGPPKVQGMR